MSAALTAPTAAMVTTAAALGDKGSSFETWLFMYLVVAAIAGMVGFLVGLSMRHPAAHSCRVCGDGVLEQCGDVCARCHALVDGAEVPLLAAVPPRSSTDDVRAALAGLQARVRRARSRR